MRKLKSKLDPPQDVWDIPATTLATRAQEVEVLGGRKGKFFAGGRLSFRGDHGGTRRSSVTRPTANGLKFIVGGDLRMRRQSFEHRSQVRVSLVGERWNGIMSVTSLSESVRMPLSSWCTAMTPP